MTEIRLANEADAEGDCARCGDAIELGDKVRWMPAGYGPEGTIVLLHNDCAAAEENAR